MGLSDDETRDEGFGLGDGGCLTVCWTMGNLGL